MAHQRGDVDQRQEMANVGFPLHGVERCRRRRGGSEIAGPVPPRGKGSVVGDAGSEQREHVVTLLDGIGFGTERDRRVDLRSPRPYG